MVSAAAPIVITFASRQGTPTPPLPLAKGPPPLCPEWLAQLSSGTAVQTWLKLLSHHTHMMSQQHVMTRSWFEEGALVLIFRSIVHVPNKPCSAFAVQEVMHSYTSEMKAGSPAPTKSNNFFSTTDTTQSGNPYPPDSSHSTCCGVFSGKPESRGSLPISHTSREEQSSHPGRIPRHTGFPVPEDSYLLKAHGWWQMAAYLKEPIISWYWIATMF